MLIKLNIIFIGSSLSLERNHLNQQNAKGKTSYTFSPDSIQESQSKIVVRKNLKILYSDPDNKELFPSKDFVVGFSRATNLKEILVPTRLPVINDRSDSNLPPCCYKCKAKVCGICKNYFAVGNKFKSLSAKDTFKMKHRMDCNATNVIYLITCMACKLQYAGSSVNFKPCFREHKSDIKQKTMQDCRSLGFLS